MRAAQPTVQISTVEGDRSEAQRVLLSSTPCVQEEPDPQRRPTVCTSERCQPSAKGPTNGPNLNGRRRSKRSEARALSSRFEEGMKLVALMRPRLRSVTLSPSAERMQENQVRSAAHFRTGGVVVSPPRHPPFSHGCLEAPGPPPMPLRVRMQFIRAEAIG